VAASFSAKALLPLVFLPIISISMGFSYTRHAISAKVAHDDKPQPPYRAGETAPPPPYFAEAHVRMQNGLQTKALQSSLPAGSALKWEGMI
jgi:hypothetical protein